MGVRSNEFKEGRASIVSNIACAMRIFRRTNREMRKVRTTTVGNIRDGREKKIETIETHGKRDTNVSATK